MLVSNSEFREVSLQIPQVPAVVHMEDVVRFCESNVAEERRILSCPETRMSMPFEKVNALSFAYRVIRFNGLLPCVSRCKARSPGPGRPFTPMCF